jgi:inhibitor of KinA sporulation pathway (predicted exonuclease)|tara:strand:+ start:390 stop:644 length:255 start_codon:yes stop_codon:yes gene_type:complete
VIENIHHLYKRNHIQLEIELPGHLNKFQLRQILFQNLNNQIVKLFHTAVADDDVSLIDYNCKDFEHIEQNQTEEIFDEVNTYFV